MENITFKFLWYAIIVFIYVDIKNMAILSKKYIEHNKFILNHSMVINNDIIILVVLCLLHRKC